MTAISERDAQFRSSRRGRRPWIVIGCLGVILLVALLAAFGSVLASQDPAAQDTALGMSGPSAEHWLGTDQLGRDIFARMIAGARTAFVGPLIVAISSFLIGNFLGLLGGYFGGWIDSLIMRWVDLMWAIPSLLVIIVVSGAFSGGYWLAIGLLILLIVPLDVRVERSDARAGTPALRRGCQDPWCPEQADPDLSHLAQHRPCRCC